MKLRRILATEFNEQVASLVTKSMPGKPLHGRWNAIGSTELKVRDHPELGKAFSIIAESTRAAVDKAKAVAAKSAASKTSLASPGADDDEAFRENNKKYTVNAAELLNTPKFIAMATISTVAKTCLTHFLLWSQKAQKNVNIASQKAHKEGSSYMGYQLSWLQKFLQVGLLNFLLIESEFGGNGLFSISNSSVRLTTTWNNSNRGNKQKHMNNIFVWVGQFHSLYIVVSRSGDVQPSPQRCKTDRPLTKLTAKLTHLVYRHSKTKIRHLNQVGQRPTFNWITIFIRLLKQARYSTLLQFLARSFLSYG